MAEHRCDECGRTPAPYEFVGTEASYDDYGRFEWQSTTYLCAECAAEWELDAVGEDAEAAYQRDVAGPLLGLDEDERQSERAQEERTRHDYFGY